MNFEQVYSDYFKRVYSYIRARVSSETAADDICSEVWETVFEKQNYYDMDKGNIEQWLFTIARNKVNSYFRLYYIKNIFSFSEKENFCADKEKQPAEQFAQMEDTKQLQIALSTLLPRERDLISLKFFSSLNNRQIAAVSSLSESNVGTILNRAMQKIRLTLENL